MAVQGVGFTHVSACVTMSVQEKGVPSQISLSFVQVFCATVSICSTIWLKSAAILLGFPSIGIRSISHRTCLSLCFQVELTMTMKDQLKVICEKLNHEKWNKSRLRGLSLFGLLFWINQSKFLLFNEIKATLCLHHSEDWWKILSLDTLYPDLGPEERAVQPWTRMAKR